MTNLVSKSTIVQICRGAWLPQYDVRFIAINDDVDSAKGENDFAVQKGQANPHPASQTGASQRQSSRRR